MKFTKQNYTIITNVEFLITNKKNWVVRQFTDSTPYLYVMNCVPTIFGLKPR